MRNITFAMKWHEVLKSYSDDIRREVYDAVIEYAATGTIIEMQPISQMAFDFIRYEIDEKARRKEARAAKKQRSGKSAEENKREDIEDCQPDTDVPGQETIVVNGDGDRITFNDKRTRWDDMENVPDLSRNYYHSRSRHHHTSGGLTNDCFETEPFSTMVCRSLQSW